MTNTSEETETASTSIPDAHLAAGPAAIDYVVVRSRRRRKTIGFAVQPDGSVQVSAPMRTSRREIEALIAHLDTRWIAQAALRATAVAAARKALVRGERVCYLGQQIPLRLQDTSHHRPHVTFSGECLVMSIPRHLDQAARQEAIGRALRRWYATQAAEELTQRVAQWAQRAGRAVPAVRVRNQRRLWGSCGPDGTLRFNWRLVMVPPELINYVVTHEVCHLLVRNHSAAFWAEVAKLLPDYRQRRAALRALAPSLGM